MLTFHLAFRTAGGTQIAAENGPSVTPPCALPRAAPSRLYVRASVGETPSLTLTVDPAAQTLAPDAHATVLHYFRLADGTVRPLPAAPRPLRLAAGDAYVAVTPAAAGLAAGEPGGASAAIARFVHLRDYFNADKLAAALLAHLAELGPGSPTAGAAVLVIEAR